ncbi:MAG: hypothetical protein ACXWLH_04370 [Candidatus Saccharimonadales bacterium]
MPVISLGECLSEAAAEGCQPFIYDADHALFIANHLEFPLNPYVLSDMFHALREANPRQATELEPYPLVRSFAGDTYGLPKLQETYADKKAAIEIADSTAEVMRQVHAKLFDEIYPLNHFEAEVRPGQPVILRIFGAPELHEFSEGRIGEAGWQFGVYEYGTNNADIPEWEITLYAGLGHIASFAT